MERLCQEHGNPSYLNAGKHGGNCDVRFGPCHSESCWLLCSWAASSTSLCWRSSSFATGGLCCIAGSNADGGSTGTCRRAPQCGRALVLEPLLRKSARRDSQHHLVGVFPL